MSANCVTQFPQILIACTKFQISHGIYIDFVTWLAPLSLFSEYFQII